MGDAKLVTVYMAVLLDKMGAMMVLPLLPYIARTMHGTSLDVGLLQSLYSLMQVFGTLTLGVLADTWGKRRTLLLSLLCSSVFLLACGLAGSIRQLLLFRAAHGFFAGTVSICQAIVADVARAEERVGKMALIMAAYGVGVVLGPGLAGLIAPFGVLPVCAAASFCSLLNFCLGWWQIPDIQTEHVEDAPGGWQGWRELLKALFSDQHLLAVCFLSFCQELGMGIFMGVSALFFQDRYGITASELGLLFCAAGAAMVAFQGFVVSKFVKAVGRPNSICLGWLLRLATYLALAQLYLPLLPWFSAVCVVAGGALIDPCAASLTSDRAPQGLSGIFLGAYQAAASTGSFLGPALGGLVYDGHETAPYWLAAAASLACLPALAELRQAEKGEPLLEEEEQPIQKLLTEASPNRKRALMQASNRLRSMADAGVSYFQLPLPELACRTLRQKDRISDQQLGYRHRSKTEVLTPLRERSNDRLERLLLRQYSMQASDRWAEARPRPG